MTLFEVYKQSIKQLKNPDIDEISIRILLCEINDLKTMSDFYIHKDEEIHDLPRFQLYFSDFLDGKPVQYILEKTTFYGNEFYVDEHVLIPRQESEEVVDFAIKKAHEIFGSKTVDICDVCSGSGIMGISLARNLNVNKVYFSDISKEAIEVSRRNATNLKVQGVFFCGDALEPLLNDNIHADILISNPPYILKNEKVDESVLDYEPHLALFTSEDFEVYKKIITNLKYVKNDTLLAVFELGINTRSVVEEFIKTNLPTAQFGFAKDINGKERILYIVLK